MKRALGFILFVFAAAAVFSQRKNPAVLSVNGTAVYTDELAYLFRKNYTSKNDHNREKVDEYLNLYVRFKLKVTEALNRGFDTTRQFVKEFNTYRSELQKTYLHEEKLIDSLVQLTYERLKEEISASHILVAVPVDASPADTLHAWKRVTELLVRAKNEPFHELAEKYSDDPSARNNKGKLGYFTAMQMVYPFEVAAYKGKTGDVVGPVRTRFGYHLIKIEDRRPTRGEVEVSHIMLRNLPDRDEKQTRNLIFEIHEQLKGGIPWEALCSQYSEDLNSKNNNCRLRPFGVGAFNQVPEFDAVAFSLQNAGDISDPFKTAYGWHIVRLEKKIPLPSLEELKTSLRNRVIRDERMQIARELYYNRLKKRYAFGENTDLKNILLAAADTSLTRGKWRIPQALPTDGTLVTIAGKEITAQQFIQFVKINQQVTPLKPQDYILELYRKFTESVLDEQLESDLMQVKPEYRFLLKEYYEGILLFEIMEKEVWSRAAEDSAGLRQYFESNRYKYQAGERARAVIYSAPSAEELRQLKNYLERQDSSAAAQWVREKNIRKETGNFQHSERVALQSVPWQPGLHEAENKGMYYLVHILEILKPGLLTFEEARIQVISDYQQVLEEQWLNDLKGKYPVVIHDKGRKQLIRMVRR